MAEYSDLLRGWWASKELTGCRCSDRDAAVCYENFQLRCMLRDEVPEERTKFSREDCACPCHRRELGPLVYRYTGHYYRRIGANGSLSIVGPEDLPGVVDSFRSPRK